MSGDRIRALSAASDDDGMAREVAASDAKSVMSGDSFLEGTGSDGSDLRMRSSSPATIDPREMRAQSDLGIADSKLEAWDKDMGVTDDTIANRPKVSVRCWVVRFCWLYLTLPTP